MVCIDNLIGLKTIILFFSQLFVDFLLDIFVNGGIMRIGYSAWGFIGDGVVDSPDGGRLTRSVFLENLITNGYDIIWLQQNRDVDENQQPLFSKQNESLYSTNQRKTLCNIKYDNEYPDIDILFLEWRWRLPGRNCDVDKSSKAYTPDLDRQYDLLKFYLLNPNVKIIIWDKDETMTMEDETELLHLRKKDDLIILSPALYPQKLFIERKTLLFPCDLDSIRGTKVNEDIKYLIGYVGSQYERDEQVYKYINPFSFKYPEAVIFAGNWNKYPEKAARNSLNFPAIKFVDRILPKDMSNIYRNCLTSVLMCKKNYAEHGHITQRIHEVAANGVIGIGLKEQKGIDEFILPINIISDAYDLCNCIDRLCSMPEVRRQAILDEQIELLKPFHIVNVIKQFEKIIKGK